MGGSATADAPVEFDRLPPPWAPGSARPHLPVGVAVVSVVIAFLAVAMVLAGLLFTFHAALGPFVPASVEIFPSIDLLGAATLVVLGGSLLVVATCLWRQEPWALWTTIVLVFAACTYLVFTGLISYLLIVLAGLLVYLLAVRRYFY